MGLTSKLKGDKYGFVDSDGRWVVEPKFDAVHDYSEDIAAVKIKWNDFEGDWGYIRIDGSYLVPPVFCIAEDFHEGYAKVKTSLNARLLVQPDGSRILKSFDDIANGIINESDFDDEKIVGVPYNDKVGYIDSNGYWYDKIS